MKYRTILEKTANEKSLDLLRKDGVVTVAEGPKLKRGRPTGQTCLQVGVRKKKPVSQILPSDLVPSQYYGIPTDVVETREIFPDTDQKSRHRPVMGGISMCDANSTSCTLGAVVVDSLTGNLVALTNNHCAGLLYDADYATPDRAYKSEFVKGLAMIQPSPSDGGTVAQDKIGIVVRAVPMIFGLGATNTCDSAIVSIDGIDNAWFTQYGGGAIDGSRDSLLFLPAEDIWVGMEVWKAGRTSGLRDGEVTQANMSVNVQYGTTNNDRVAFTNIIQVKPLSHDTFTMGGDSGATIVGEYEGQDYIVGHHFAGDGYHGYAAQIENVANELKIEAWNRRVVTSTSVDLGFPALGTFTWNGFVWRYGDGPTHDRITHTVVEE